MHLHFKIRLYKFFYSLYSNLKKDLYLETKEIFVIISVVNVRFCTLKPKPMVSQLIVRSVARFAQI